MTTDYAVKARRWERETAEAIPRRIPTDAGRV